MTGDIGTAAVNMFNGSHNPFPSSTIPLVQVLHHISSDVHAQAIQRIRRILHTRGKKAYDIAKRDLPAVTFCGTFSPKRGKEYLVQHSGIVHIDIDNLNDPDKTRKTLLCSGLLYCFISPSRQGLKVGFHILPVADDQAYKHAWNCIATMLHTTYGIVADKSGKDVSRLCYVSYDTNIFIDLGARIVSIPAPAPAPVIPLPSHTEDLPSTCTDRKARYLYTALCNAQAILDRSEDGNRHAARLRAGRLLGGYVGEFLNTEQAFELLEVAVVRNTRAPAQALHTLRQAIAYGARHPITFQSLEAERLTWKGARV